MNLLARIRTAIAGTRLRKPMVWFVTALALMAGLLQWIIWLQRHPIVENAIPGPPRSDYQLSDFTLRVFDENGGISFDVKAPRLSKHPYLGSLDIDSPSIFIKDSNGKDWSAKSQRAWVSKDGKSLTLTGQARIVELAASIAPISIASEKVEADLSANVLRSPTPATLTGSGTRMTGSRLEVRMNEKTMMLNDQVRIRYDGNKRS